MKKLLSLLLTLIVLLPVMAAEEPLCFTAEKDGSTIRLRKMGSPSASISISTDGSNWNTYTFGSTITLSNAGDKIYFSSGNATNIKFSTSTEDYFYFEMTGSIAANGNIMSLLKKDCSITTVPEYGFLRLFNGCSSLTTAPQLPATSLNFGCYVGMFNDCTNLISAPQLPATTLADYCYYTMFANCSKLVDAPVLPANTLSTACYARMFYQCKKLVNTPILQATTLTENCYLEMFFGCEKVNKIVVGFNEWNISSATSDWLMGVSSEGTFVCPNGLQEKRGTSNIPSNWEISHPQYLCFTANTAGSTVALEKYNNRSTAMQVEYSSNGAAWYDYVPGETGNITLANEGDCVYFKAKSKNTIFNGQSSYYYFNMTGSIGASGNIMSLLDATCESTIIEGTALEYAFNALFKDCASLTSAPELPATTLNYGCYRNMFNGCTNLETAPELPALSLATRAYESMFANCTRLAEAPELPATSLSGYCYKNMFENCTALEEAPILPAKILKGYCYQNMFKGCSNLKSIKVGFNNWTGSEGYAATGNWVDGVSDTGNFECPAALEISNDASHVPASWTISQPKYLCFTAKTAGAQVALIKNGTPNTIQFQTSDNGYVWNNYTIGEAKTLSKVGDYIYFRANDIYSTMGNSDYNCYQFTLSEDVAASGSIMSLMDSTCNKTSMLGTYTFANLFKDCIHLTQAPKLTATSVSAYGYYKMFAGCTGLTNAPELPATTLNVACYHSMFLDCANLTTAPELNAPLSAWCYSNMFENCTSLTTAPNLPATVLVSYCYNEMFKGCSNLNNITVGFNNWLLNATNNWMNGVAAEGTFNAPGSVEDNRGVSYIPNNWTLIQPQYLCFIAETAGAQIALNKVGYPNEVSFETSTDGSTWTDYTLGSSITLANKGNSVYFRAKELTDYLSNDYSNCYNFEMYQKIGAYGNVMSLMDPTCQKTNVSSYAFIRLFDNCLTLTSAPELPAITLGDHCYDNMFSACYSLTTAPELPATTLASNCYHYMFNNCMGLTTAPELPATNLEEGCYAYMFEGCSNLTEAPELPATTLAIGCYAGMFGGCSSLTTAPDLIARNLVQDCYNNMFFNCSNLNSIRVAFTEWNASSTTSWLGYVADKGTFYCLNGLDTELVGSDYIPEGWTITNPRYLCFTAQQNGASVTLNKIGTPTELSLQVSTDGFSWNDYTVGTSIDLTNVGDFVFFRNKNTTASFSLNNAHYYQYAINNKVAASGNIMSLMDPNCNKISLEGSAYTFYKLFYECTNLTSAPELPATTLNNYCYYNMFYKCSNITEAPELPATTMKTGCYQSMFSNCTKLTIAPELPATQLANECYMGMFAWCSNLIDGPSELPATTLKYRCYYEMFFRCSKFENVPTLPARTLASQCYGRMFYGDHNITKIKVEFTDWTADATSDWFQMLSWESSLTPETGEFHCPKSLTETNGVSNIPDNWKVKNYPHEVTLNAKGYSTYSASTDVKIVEGGGAYACTVEGGTIYCDSLMDVPAGTGVMLHGEPGATIKFCMVDEISEMVENDLLGTTTEENTLSAVPNEGNVYVLSGNQFMRYAGANFSANKAYFCLDYDPMASGANEFRFVFGNKEENGNTTSINEVKMAESVLDNCFNLQGQRIAKNNKGMQIMNGKVVFVK